jgi:hypothetical protein
MQSLIAPIVKTLGCLWMTKNAESGEGKSLDERVQALALDED